MAFSVLVLGAGRGGTSLLGGLLDFHPEIQLDFELESARILMAEDASTTRERCRRFRAVCEAAGRDSRKRLYGNKITTEQLHGIERRPDYAEPPDPQALEAFFLEAMAGIKVIFILRDGRTCVRSKVRRRGLDVEAACRRWQYAVGVLDYLRGEHPDCHTVRFEDLLASPRAVLRALCAEIGVAYDAAMLAGTANPRMLAEYRRESFDPSPARLDGVPAGAEAILAEDLLRLGYQLR